MILPDRFIAILIQAEMPLTNGRLPLLQVNLTPPKLPRGCLIDEGTKIALTAAAGAENHNLDRRFFDSRPRHQSFCQGQNHSMNQMVWDRCGDCSGSGKVKATARKRLCPACEGLGYIYHSVWSGTEAPPRRTPRRSRHTKSKKLPESS